MRPFKKPQGWDPSLAEQTLANHGKHTEEARKAREREMLASLGLADEEGISLEDDGGDLDEDGSPDVEPDESARRELEARRRQAVDAQGYDKYMADLKQRARRAVLKLRSSEECDVDTIAQLELEIGVLDQENGVLKRRVNSSKAGSNLGDQATIVLGQYEEDIQHLKARVAQLECNVASRDTTIEQLHAELAAAHEQGSASRAAGHAGTSNGGPPASEAKLQQQIAALEQANNKLQRQLDVAQSAGPQQSSSPGAESNGEAAAQVALLQEQLRESVAKHQQELQALEEQLKAKQLQLDQFRQQRVEAMQAGTAEAKGKQKGAPQVESSRIMAKVEEMLPIIDELHHFRDGIMADLMSMHSEVFNEKFHKQLLRTVRDQELDMRRKLQSEIRGEVQAAERRADEAHAEIESIRDSCEQTIKITKIETNAMIQHVQEKWRAEFEKRKRLHNLVLELKGSIRVLCRIRPFLEKEQQNLEKDRRGNVIVPVQPLNEEALRIVTEKGDKDFEFDRTFAHTEGQTQVFEEVCGLITTVLDGYNVCIMAYGQTGSGKTYTMEGPDSDPGVNSRALTELFRLAQERSEDWDYRFQASVLEIYNERIYDLLAGGRDQDGDKLDVKQGPEGMYVPGQSMEAVGEVKEVAEVMRRAKQNRSTFATNMNEHSSRSHLVLSLFVTAVSKSGGTKMRGKLHLIDLAGSERVGRSGAQGDRLKEAQNINKSLSALGDVIQALQQRSGHIPFRNSKLTRLLEDSLGASSKCVLVVNVSPAAENVPETKCSLEFASRARKVDLGRAKQSIETHGAGHNDSTPSTPVAPIPPSATPRTRPASARPAFNRAPVESHAIATTPEPALNRGGSSSSLSSLSQGPKSSSTSLSSLQGGGRSKLPRPGSAAPR
mmetsp:Transcript_536/g.1389  ORF Transcript_536/g.1389 Transcript_536/m.1389 type:complete len:891 (-) Transcript_536:598-3270(-)